MRFRPFRLIFLNPHRKLGYAITKRLTTDLKQQGYNALEDVMSVSISIAQPVAYEVATRLRERLVF